MKKSIFTLFFTFVFFTSFQMNFAMEYVTHYMQETSKQFDEYSWWVKAPALFIGTYASFKLCDYISSKYWNTKIATQLDVQNLTLQVQTANGTIAQLQQLNSSRLPIAGLETRIKALEKFEKAKRTMTLSKLERLDNLEKSMKNAHCELMQIHELLKHNIHPIFDTSKTRRKSCELLSSANWLEESGAKELSLKKRKKKHRKKDEKPLSKLDGKYHSGGVGTPRNDFNSDSDEKGKEKTSDN